MRKNTIRSGCVRRGGQKSWKLANVSNWWSLKGYHVLNQLLKFVHKHLFTSFSFVLNCSYSSLPFLQIFFFSKCSLLEWRCSQREVWEQMNYSDSVQIIQPYNYLSIYCLLDCWVSTRWVQYQQPTYFNCCINFRFLEPSRISCFQTQKKFSSSYFLFVCD